MSQFIDLLGEKLLNKDGEIDTATALDGKTAVGFYFSAHWCPPCKGFTPVLAEKYKALKEAGKDFEIVFISSDQDEDQFKSYHAEMPWLAMPFSQTKLNGDLNKKYKTNGIPYLVIVDGKTTETLTTDGRSVITGGSYLTDYPFRPIKLSELDCWQTHLFGEKLNNKGTEVSTRDTLKDLDYLMIYFSGHWCPPCRQFTPKLVTKYTALKEAGKKFELIFASSDKTNDEFNDYYKEMPWMALPYADRALKERLAKFYGCKGIPMLVVINAQTGETVTTDGTSRIASEDYLDDYPYLPKVVYDISESLDGIDEGAALILVQDLVDKPTQKANAKVLVAAVKDKSATFENKVVKYFTGNGGGPLKMIKTDLGFEVAPSKTDLTLTKIDPPGEAWGCDGCGKSGDKAKERYRNVDADFDWCELCWGLKDSEVKEDQKVATMIIVDLTNKKYWKRESTTSTLTLEALTSMLQAFSEDKLESKVLTIGG